MNDPVSSRRSDPVGIFLLTACALIWGVAFVAQDVGMDYVGPFTFIASRNYLGTTFLMICMAVYGRTPAGRERAKAPERKTRVRNSLKGGLVCGIFLCSASCFQQVGIMTTNVGTAGFVTALYIIFVPIIGLLLGRKAGLKVWVAAAAALFGLYLLCMKGGFSLSRGAFLILICAVLFAVQITCVDHFVPNADGVLLSCVQFAVCAVIGTVLALIFETVRFSDILNAAAPILYAGVLSSGVAYTFQVLGQSRVRPATASLLMSLESVFSALAGWLILGQSMTGREMLGALIMFLAVLLAQF